MIEQYPAPAGQSITLPSTALPALVFMTVGHIVDLSHPQVDVSVLSRVEARIALALLDHGREVLRAAHNLD